jgi:hypothetical protein
LGERLRNDQGRVVRRDDHPVGERDVAGDLASLAVWRHQCDLPGCLSRREDVVEGGEIEVDRVDVHVAAAVHGELVPPVGRDVTEIGVPYARAVRLHADQFLTGDEHPPVR